MKNDLAKLCFFFPLLFLGGWKSRETFSAANAMQWGFFALVPVLIAGESHDWGSEGEASLVSVLESINGIVS